MANTSLKKLGFNSSKQFEPRVIEVGEGSIEVKQYLPTLDKVALVSQAVKSSIDERGLVNTMVLETTLHYLIVVNYTNITFTAKQLEDMTRTYDILESHGLIDLVLSEVPKGDYDDIFESAQGEAARVESFTLATSSTLLAQMKSAEMVNTLSEGREKIVDELSKQMPNKPS